jgi:methylenetetrahydrofolate reductase (NADPH)
MTRPHISCEFFPPREAAARDKLGANVASKLAELEPEFFSVTYGAGGSTRDGTRQTVEMLLKARHEGVPHLSMGSDDETQIKGLLDQYLEAGVKRIVALRGDLPSGFGNRFANNAETLVRLIRDHAGDAFDLIVAAYPEVHPDATSMSQDLDYFERKVAAGANSAITQYFYNADAYADFMDRCQARGIEIPIVAGVMPITNYESLVRFSAKCGAEIPRWLDFALRDKDEDIVKFGVEVVTRLCERLLHMGAPGLHFYTLNRWGATYRICENLKLVP